MLGNLDRNTKVVNTNFNERINNLENLLNMWSCRHLSLRGKVTVIHNLVISQLLCTSSAFVVSKWVVEKVQMILNKFLWHAKKPKIKQAIIIGKLEDGGLKMPDFESKLKINENVMDSKVI